MRRFTARLAAAACVVIGTASLAVIPSGAQAASGSTATSTYIVRLRTDAAGQRAVTGLAARLVAPYGGTVTHTYSSVFRGFSVRLPAGAARLLAANPAVESVSADGTVHATGVEGDAPWGLDRVDQRHRPLNGKFKYPDRPGKGAHVYVVDTGINPAHSEFTGRVGASRNFSPTCLLLTCTVDPANWNSLTACGPGSLYAGHGTHVASTAVGTKFGVAKKATVHAIRVLGCDGSGEDSDIIAALDWLAQHHQSPAVVNMSLGGTPLPALDAAVKGLVDHGISVAVAAGNDNNDACGHSPAAEPSVLTVGATTTTDERSSFSNFGTCVDLFAPGSNIAGADYASSSGGVYMSGTSMATPHVAGDLAIIRAAQPNLSAKAAQAKVLSLSTPDIVQNAGAGSTRRMLYVRGDSPPLARFHVSCSGLHCTFYAGRSSDDHRIVRYRWRFNNHGTARGKTAHHTFASAGSKTVTLLVVDNVGQRHKRTKTITVHRHH